MRRNEVVTNHTANKRLAAFPGPVLVGLALVAGACSSDDASSRLASVTVAADTTIGPGNEEPPETVARAPEADAPPESDVVIEAAPSATCLEALPDIEMECGRLEVPAYYDEPSGDTFSLPYVVLPALGDSPSDEPLVFMQGGPGFSTLAIVPFFVENSEFRNDRDMIFLEQRGTDPSGVFLRCGPNLASREDVQECHDRFVKDGIDLSTFTTLNAARDLATLRAELGIDRWHLLGGSYGTTLAMVAMDNDPEGTASVILDAPTAPDVIIYNADVESLLNAYSKVFADCAADSDCNRRNPELFHANIANVERLFQEPWDITSTELVEVFGPAFDHRVYLEVSASLLAGQPGALPALVTAVADRQPDALLELVAGDELDDADGSAERDAEIGPSEFAQGLNFSIYCAEEAPFFDRDTNPIETVDEWPDGTVEFFLPAFDEVCEIWDVDPADPADVDQIRSAIPTLILAGEYDHTTPIRQGEIAAAGLSNSELIEVPSTGHTTLDNACARSIMVEFLRAPGGDRTCLAEIAPIAWQ
ncbi:MAG: alpha/beta fold hydrolase [Ilumatobacter sp.]